MRCLISGIAIGLCVGILHCRADSASGARVTGVTVASSDPSSPYSSSATLTSLTVAGETITEFITPSAVESSGLAAGSAGHSIYWASGDSQPATTLEAVLLGADITSGVLNPVGTSGVIDLIFPHPIANTNGSLPDVFLFNVDPGSGNTESWTVSAITGGRPDSRITGSAFSFDSTLDPATNPLGNTGVGVSFAYASGSQTQNNWGIGFDLQDDLGVQHNLIGLRINTGSGDPSVVVATPSFAEGVASGGLLTNWDFEDTTAPFAQGWTSEGTGTGPIAHRGLTPTGLDAPGTGAAYFQPNVEQTFQTATIGPEWQLDMLFAAEEATSNRTLYMQIRNPNGGQINARVAPGTTAQFGDFEIFDGSAWRTIAADAVEYSLDANADNDFEDAGDLLNVYSLRFVGNYGALDPSYDVFLSAANSPTLAMISNDLDFFQYRDPAIGVGPSQVRFLAINTDGDYLVDQVSLATIPEPASVCLMLLGGLGLLGIPRRRRRRQPTRGKI